MRRVEEESALPTRPRILHVITRLDVGGSSTSTLISVDRLRAHGFETALAYGPTHDPDGRIARLLAERGVVRFFIPSLRRAPAPWRDLAALFALIRLVRRERFDLVHTHTSKAGVLGRLAAGACRLPVVHTPHGHIFYGYFGPLLTQLFVYVERGLAPGTTRIVSLTDAETRESLERRIGRPAQYVTIPSGVPLTQFSDLPETLGQTFRAVWRIPPKAVLFVSAGRLTPIKGFDLLLRAWAQIPRREPPLYLALVGDGEQRSALETLAAETGIADHVRFTGEQPDIRGALQAADAFVLASRNEGMGRVFVEAMAAGRPPIGTTVGGVPTLIRDRENGLLVPPEDPAALAQAMAALADDPAWRRALGARARTSVYPLYDEDTMLARLADLYRHVLAP